MLGLQVRTATRTVCSTGAQTQGFVNNSVFPRILLYQLNGIPSPNDYNSFLQLEIIKNNNNNNKCAMRTINYQGAERSGARL